MKFDTPGSLLICMEPASARSERRELLAERVGDGPLPVHFGGEAVVIAGNAAQQAVGGFRVSGVGGVRTCAGSLGCLIDGVELGLLARQAGEIEFITELAA